MKEIMTRIIETVGSMNYEQQRAIIVIILIVVGSIFISTIILTLLKHILDGKIMYSILTIIAILVIMYILSSRGITLDSIVGSIADSIMENLLIIFS